MRWFAMISVIGLAGCVVTVEQPGPTKPSQPAPTKSVKKAPSVPTSSDVTRFKQVVSRVEPIAEQQCRARTKGANCDFLIVLDNRKGLPANAYQTLDRSGRPVLAFTRALVADVRNSDELAFVMGHEAAHHIAGHIPRQQQNAAVGAIVLGKLASLTGASSTAVRQASDLGAAVGARSYSKNFELEADALGTVITKRAGFNPVRGAAFFSQIPDPGDRFLGTHPPNAQRMETVRRVNASL